LSFKFIILFVCIAGCGVKSNPIAPPGTELPSYESQFLKPSNPEVK
jgi:hypothetical protein